TPPRPRQGRPCVVASGHATLATKRRLLRTLGRIFTGWIAPACGWLIYSIASSAMPSNVGETLRSRVRAVCRLITNPKLAARMTGSLSAYLKRLLAKARSRIPSGKRSIWPIEESRFGCDPSQLRVFVDTAPPDPAVVAALLYRENWHR